MTRRFTILIAVLAVMLSLAPASSAEDLENMIYMDLEGGRVVIQTRPDLAPNHVARIKELVREEFYDGIVFHRVIDGFMAQTGDPTGTGAGGTGVKLPAEFTPTNFGRGTIGMARTNDPNSGDSQWFICFDDCSFLNGKYTVWGQVVDGMDHVDAITRGEPPADPDQIVQLQVAADAQ